MSGISTQPAREQRVIDIDAPATWPSRLRSIATRTATAMREQAGRHTSDLALPATFASDINAELHGATIRAFHCTRLLDPESAALRQEGLRASSDSLMRSKLHAAVAAGAITRWQADQLHADSPLHRQRRNREHLLCAVTTRRTLDEEADGLDLLLTHWGGEIIYFWQRNEALIARLRSIGKPSIVVVDLKPGRPQDLWSPDPAALIVGRVLGSVNACGDVHYRLTPGTSVPVVDIWQPGNNDYDRHKQLPST